MWLMPQMSTAKLMHSITPLMIFQTYSAHSTSPSSGEIVPHWWLIAIVKTIKARDKAYKKYCKSWKVLHALVQRQIRSSKQSFVQSKLNTNHNAKDWWITLNQLTKNHQPKVTSDKHLVGRKFISSGEFGSSISNYYISVGGEAFQHANPASINNEPLQHPSIVK